MSKPSYGKLARLAFGRRKTMKCHYREESLACAFHYNGLCLRDHNYECPACAMKNLSHGEMVQIAEERKDLVKVVRCKDCKWAEPYRAGSGNVYFACQEFGVSALSDDDYCSYGERKKKTDAEIC